MKELDISSWEAFQQSLESVCTEMEQMAETIAANNRTIEAYLDRDLELDQLIAATEREIMSELIAQNELEFFEGEYDPNSTTRASLVPKIPTLEDLRAKNQELKQERQAGKERVEALAARREALRLALVEKKNDLKKSTSVLGQKQLELTSLKKAWKNAEMTGILFSSDGDGNPLAVLLDEKGFLETMLRDKENAGPVTDPEKFFDHLNGLYEIA